ncbi:MltA domain-containing protein [Microvirga sp. W0021]|uniref:peptidoglycan lytic exotransglycosylase n=1 Tax=Hohaiivirga grylli TaxID=3133970 RepID=A0ABV0BHN0_9HYPH
MTSTFAQAAPSGDIHLKKLAFSELQGWKNDAQDVAYAVFLKSCEALENDKSVLRPAKSMEDALRSICKKAFQLGSLDSEKARQFFEAEFTPWLVNYKGSDTVLLTGYYEPELSGSLVATDEFSVPLLARPDDLETIPEGESRPGIEAGLRGAKRTSKGFEPYPTRQEIEEGALRDKAQPLVYLRRPSEAFIIHVQGSTRIRLPDNSSVRVAYAGRNGQPYTSIGRLLIERGAILQDEMSLERLMGWLDANPKDARALMHQNKSFIFFRLATELSEHEGPIGGQGIPLFPERSLAVDRNIWSYGMPFWLEGVLPVTENQTKPLNRLMIAQDTGSAILGAARGDFYFGSGKAAGTLAGLMRHQTRFIVLQPRGLKPAVPDAHYEQ